jgi:hypothetical protein
MATKESARKSLMSWYRQCLGEDVDHASAVLVLLRCCGVAVLVLVLLRVDGGLVDDHVVAVLVDDHDELQLLVLQAEDNGLVDEHVVAVLVDDHDELQLLVLQAEDDGLVDEHVVVVLVVGHDIVVDRQEGVFSITLSTKGVSIVVFR